MEPKRESGRFARISAFRRRKFISLPAETVGDASAFSANIGQLFFLRSFGANILTAAEPIDDGNIVRNFICLFEELNRVIELFSVIE